jgi:transposase-like protein
VPKLAAIMDEAETDVMTFPREHRVQLLSPNPIERVNSEIKRCTEAVGIRLVCAILLEQNDEWAVQRA